MRPAELPGGAVHASGPGETAAPFLVVGHIPSPGRADARSAVPRARAMPSANGRVWDVGGLGCWLGRAGVELVGCTPSYRWRLADTVIVL